MHMKKIAIFVVVLVMIGAALLAGSPAARAQALSSAAQIQAMIAQLMQQVQQLQAQLQTMQGSTGANQSTSLSSSVGDVQASVEAGCAINANLGYGSRGNSVSLLQNVLHADGSYPEGLVTGYYGSLTTAAVKQFQQNHGIAATGSVDGPTAALVNVIIPQHYSCGPIGFQKLTGLLQAAQVSTDMWGSYTLTVGSSGDATTNVSGTLVYRVRAANDTVAGLLGQYVNQRVVVAGAVTHYALEGGFWGIVAQSVYPADVVTPGNGAIVVTSPQAGAQWAVGKTYTIQWAMNQKDSLASQGTVTITVARPLPACLRSTPPCMIAMPVMAPYTIASKAPNTGSYTWTIPTTLPGLNMGSQEITIVLDGTNVRGVSGTFSIVGAQSDKTLTIATGSVPAGVVGTPYTTTIQAQGGTGEYAWSLVGGSLPPGITHDTGGIVCFAAPCPQPFVLGGTPTQGGTYSFTVQVTSGTQTATQVFSLVILSTSSNGVVIKTTAVPSGAVGKSYAATIMASGGSDNYAWDIVDGSLPDGLKLTSPVCIKFPCQVGASLSGTPQKAGNYSFAVRVTSGFLSAVQKFSLDVTASPSLY